MEPSRSLPHHHSTFRQFSGHAYSDWRRMASSTVATPAPRRGNASTNREQYAGFTDLPAELRNRIYELIAPPRNQHVTICAEKGGRDVPYALSRTCRLVRRETAPYFLSGQGATLILVMRTAEDVAACQDWISFVPEYSLSEIRMIRIKHMHCCWNLKVDELGLVNRGNILCAGCKGCEVFFHLDLDEELPVKCYSPTTSECKQRREFRSRANLVRDGVNVLPIEVEGPRAGGRKMTRECLRIAVEMLAGFGRDGREGQHRWA